MVCIPKFHYLIDVPSEILVDIGRFVVKVVADQVPVIITLHAIIFEIQTKLVPPRDCGHFIEQTLKLTDPRDVQKQRLGTQTLFHVLRKRSDKENCRNIKAPKHLSQI